MFNLEISQSGSNVAHVILNWVILKIVWVKLCYTKKKNFGKLTSSQPLPKNTVLILYVFHSLIPLLQ